MAKRIKLLVNERKAWTKRVKELILAKLGRVKVVDSGADITITIGGDGTLFYYLDQLEGLVLPIGTQKSGIAIPFSLALKDLDNILESKPVSVISLEAWINGKPFGKAINDIVAHTTDYRLHEFRLEMPEWTWTFKGDGLILSTPLGSSSYNRSAGGPVVDRDLEVISATPIAPYTPTSPRILDASKSYTLSSDSEFALILDGCRIKKVSAREKVKIKKGRSYKLLVPRVCQKF